MIKFYWRRASSSFVFLGLVVLVAVLLTTVAFSSPAERILTRTEKNLLHSYHMLANPVVFPVLPGQALHVH